MFYTDKLKFLRKSNSLSQNDMAKILNISRNRYSQYETEYDIMPIKHLIAICNYCNISIDYIFSFTDVVQYDNVNCNHNSILSGMRIKELRKNHNNIPQKSLAIDLNISQSAITDYECGKIIIPTDYLYLLCKKYNMSADYLLGRIDFIPDWCSK